MSTYSWLSSLGVALAGMVAAIAPSQVPLQAPPLLVGTVDVRIGGSDESRPSYLFTDIRGVTSDLQNRIIVVDRRENSARLFSPTGEYLYSVGREGAGPGDLRDPCCAAVDAMERLWIKERGNLRYSVFRIEPRSGRFLYSVPLSTNPIGQSFPTTWGPDGMLMDPSNLLGGAGEYVRAFVDSLGRVMRRDTIPAPNADSLPSVQIRTCAPSPSTACGTTGFGHPYGPAALIAFGPAGQVARAISSNYAIAWTDASGRRIALIRRSISGPALSDVERSRAQRQIDTIAARMRRPGVQVTGVLPKVPAAKPPLADLGFDLEGRLWVERTVVAGQPREADVYDASGRWVAVMRWPANVRLASSWAVRGQSGLGLESDSLGGEAVVRLRFAPGR